MACWRRRQALAGVVAPCTVHWVPPDQAFQLLLRLQLCNLLPKQPLLAVRGRAERAGGGDERPLRVRAGAALGGGGLVAGLGGLGDAAQQRVAEQAGQAGGEDAQATPSQPPEKVFISHDIIYALLTSITIFSGKQAFDVFQELSLTCELVRTISCTIGSFF